MSRSSSKSSSTKSKPKSPSSSGSALKRLTHELQDLNTSPCEATLHLGPSSDEDLFRWEAVIKGPRDPASPYFGGLWLTAIKIPDNYPLVPPNVKFITPICHPNVHFSSGEICLTLLTSEHWTPTYTISSTLNAIQQLLNDPGLESPLNVDVANLYREHDSLAAEGLIRFWTSEKRWQGEGKGEWISEKAPGTGGHNSI